MPRSSDPGPTEESPNEPSPEAPAEPSTHDRRATARKLVAAKVTEATDEQRPEAQEDFLLHLYRGSELLQEGRLHEAKEELEHALALESEDTKAQDLLAATYFRLGLASRAVGMYEHLEQVFPRDTSLKINLALCHLKLGRPDSARTTLHDVVRINPNHRRAWGYLGIAHEQLAEFDQAQVAFERGGHTVMAKRMAERRNRATVPAPAMPPPEVEGEVDVREAAAVVFEELDAGELNFSLAEPGSVPDRDGWQTVELGALGDVPRHERVKSPYNKTLSPPSVRNAAVAPPAVFGEGHVSPNEAHTMAPPQGLGALTVTPPPANKIGPAPTPVISAPPPEMTRAAREQLLSFPDESAVVLHPTGVALVQIRQARGEAEPARSFALRMESLRAAKGGFTTNVLQRKSRDKETLDVLGSVVSPIVRADGNAELVLGARPAHQLVALALEDDLAFVREDLILGFETSLTYENGRLSVDDADSVAIVQLRGSGTLVLELLAAFATIDATPSRPVIARRDWMIGWIGRLVPRALPMAEAPAGQRGLVSFNGEGTVLLAGR